MRLSLRSRTRSLQSIAKTLSWNKTVIRRYVFLALTASLLASHALADNWAHWRGPTGNGVATTEHHRRVGVRQRTSNGKPLFRVGDRGRLLFGVIKFSLSPPCQTLESNQHCDSSSYPTIAIQAKNSGSKRQQLLCHTKAPIQPTALHRHHHALMESMSMPTLARVDCSVTRWPASLCGNAKTLAEW